MTIGQRIMNYRKAKNLSQEEVAEKLNVTRQTVSKWETNLSTPDFDKIIPLCELFEISSEELLRGKIETKTQDIDINDSSYDINKEKRTKCLIISILLYFISVIQIMICIPVLMMNPIVASAIFLFICGVATCILIYSSIMYKKEIHKKEELKQNKTYKQIENILSILTLIIYLGISFITFAWYITWIIWLIYALIMKIVRLIVSLNGDDNEK